MKKIKSLRTLISLVGLIVGATSMVSCGGSTYSESNDITHDSSGNIVFDNVELKVWSVIGDPDNVYLDKVNKAFNDYYAEEGIHATVTSIAESDFYTQLANTINTDPDNAPDIAILHSERLNRLAADKVFIPMDEYLNDPVVNFDASNYLSNVISECYYENQLYGVPLDVHAGVWYVREDILAKNGLSKPTCLSEFVRVCNELVKKYDEGTLWHRAMDKTDSTKTQWTQAKDLGDHYYPVVMSEGGGIEQGWIPQTAVFQNGGQLTTENGRPAWNTDGLKEVLEMFRNWQTGEGNFKGTSYAGAFVAENGSAETVWSDLSSGKAVFSCEGPWWIESRLNEYESVLGGLQDENGDVYQPLGIMNMSKLYAMDENAEYANKIYGVGHCFATTKVVTSKTKRIACALYSKYMTENAVDYTQGGHLPACRTILNSKEYTSKSWYTRYLSEFGDPENFVMLGKTKYYSAVYEGLKQLYMDVFIESKKNISVEELIRTNYDTAIQQIDSSEDL